MSRPGARALILVILIGLPIGTFPGCGGGGKPSQPITEKFKPDPDLNPTKPSTRTAAPAQIRD